MIDYIYVTSNALNPEKINYLNKLDDGNLLACKLDYYVKCGYCKHIITFFDTLYQSYNWEYYLGHCACNFWAFLSELLSTKTRNKESNWYKGYYHALLLENCLTAQIGEKIS